MSRSFFFERTRINIEICLESVSDFLGSFGGALRKPLLFLAGIAMVMTLRSARRGVQTMKNGGLTAGDSWFGTSRSTPSSASNFRYPYQATGSYGTTGSSPYGTTGSSPYGTGSSSSFFSRGSADSSSGGMASGTGLAAASDYGASSVSRFTAGAASGPVMCNGPCRATADLVNQFGNEVRVVDAAIFKDYGGVLGFYGQVETLSAVEGSGVVEKVLQSPGTNKVLVIEGGGNMHSAILTKTAVDSAKMAGWKGVIVHGVIQNAADIQTVDIGVKAIGTYPKKGRATSGSKGSTLNIAGIHFVPNTWVYCDKDGIVLSDNELTPTRFDSPSTTMGLVSSTSGSISSTMAGTTRYSTGASGMQALPGGISTGANGIEGNGMGTTGIGSNGIPGVSSSFASNTMMDTTSNNYARTLPGSGGNQPQRRYDQEGNSGYPYSHGAGNPYAYSAAEGGDGWLPIWLTLTISIAMILQP